MKKLGLILFIGILQMLSSCVVSTPSLAQKISIDRPKLVELTKQAEKGKFLEGENVNLIVENHRLRQSNQEQSQQISQLQKEVKDYKKTLYFILFGLLVVLVGLVFWNLTRKK